MPPNPDALDFARKFASQLSATLNRTIADEPVNINAVVVRGLVHLGNRITPAGFVKREHFQLRHRRGEPALFLNVSGKMLLDDEGRHLTVQSSVFALAFDRDGGRPFFHIDYERDKRDGYPEAHLQVTGHSDDVLTFTGKVGKKRGLRHGVQRDTPGLSRSCGLTTTASTTTAGNSPSTGTTSSFADSTAASSTHHPASRRAVASRPKQDPRRGQSACA